jgi:hypothetical protein
MNHTETDARNLQQYKIILVYTFDLKQSDSGQFDLK